MDVLPALSQWLDSLPDGLKPQMGFEKILRFMVLSSRLKDDILLAQAAEHPVAEPPVLLPPSVHHFLAGACSIPSKPVEIIEGLWSCVRRLVWNELSFLSDPTFPLQDHVLHRYKYGIGEHWTLVDRHFHFMSMSILIVQSGHRTIYPPMKMCTALGCSRTEKGLALSKAEQREDLLFTLSEGTVPVYNIHLYCQGWLSSIGNHGQHFDTPSSL
jgi:hypothetical protein